MQTTVDRQFASYVRAKRRGGGHIMPMFTVAHFEKFDVDGQKLWDAWTHNLVTNAGRQQAALQNYGTTSLATNGFNYIALSNGSFTETATSTSLGGEISTAGFGRAQGTVTLPGSLSTTTVADNPLSTQATTSTDTGGAGLDSTTSGTIGLTSTAGMYAGNILQVGTLPNVEYILIGTVSSSVQLSGCTRGVNSAAATGTAWPSGTAVQVIPGGCTLNLAASGTAQMTPGTLLLLNSGELVLVGAIASSTQLTGCTRGMYGTTAASQAMGTTVTIVNTTILTHTFTATGSISAQKAALLNAASTGTMGHVFAFPGGSQSFTSMQTLFVTVYIVLG